MSTRRRRENRRSRGREVMSRRRRGNRRSMRREQLSKRGRGNRRVREGGGMNEVNQERREN